MKQWEGQHIIWWLLTLAAGQGAARRRGLAPQQPSLWCSVVWTWHVMPLGLPAMLNSAVVVVHVTQQALLSWDAELLGFISGMQLQSFGAIVVLQSVTWCVTLSSAACSARECSGGGAHHAAGSAVPRC